MHIELHEPKPAPTPEQIRDVEHRLGIKFPPEYLEFVKRHNGVRLGNCFCDSPFWRDIEIERFIPLQNIPEEARYFTDSLGPKLAPIARGGCGDVLALDTGDHPGRIYYLLHDYRAEPPLFEVAPTLSAFLEMMKPFVVGKWPPDGLSYP